MATAKDDNYKAFVSPPPQTVSVLAARVLCADPTHRIWWRPVPDLPEKDQFCYVQEVQ